MTRAGANAVETDAGPVGLAELAARLGKSRVFQGKRAIGPARRILGEAFAAWNIANGDDAAAIPDGAGGWLLLAAEGALPELAANNPELAGRGVVLANVNDIYAMGGRPLALVDVVGGPDEAVVEKLCVGLRDNALRFGVPVVGGHVQSEPGPAMVSAAILGRAKRLITGFDALPGDSLLLITNLDGVWLRAENYWNCTLPRHDDRLRSNLELLVRIADEGLARAGKDVSMAGIAGTLVMLAESSGVGALLDLDRVELPEGCDRERDMAAWLSAFFSYGFLLAVAPEREAACLAPFRAQGLHAVRVGGFMDGGAVLLRRGDEIAVLHDWRKTPFTGF